MDRVPNLPNLVRHDFSAPVLQVDSLLDVVLLIDVVTALDPEPETQSFQESAHVVEGSIRIRPSAQDALHERIMFSHDGCLQKKSGDTEPRGDAYPQRVRQIETGHQARGLADFRVPRNMASAMA